MELREVIGNRRSIRYLDPEKPDVRDDEIEVNDLLRAATTRAGRIARKAGGRGPSALGLYGALDELRREGVVECRNDHEERELYRLPRKPS